jgi:hypothetical protein
MEEYFSTSLSIFNHPRTDYIRCGQCQEIIPHEWDIYKFYKKWDKYQLVEFGNIPLKDIEELKEDVEGLKKIYPWVETDRFSSLVELDRKESNKK